MTRQERLELIRASVLSFKARQAELQEDVDETDVAYDVTPVDTTYEPIGNGCYQRRNLHVN